MAVKGLIFDMDGTLVNSMGMWRDLRSMICRSFNVPIEGEVAELVQYNVPWESLRKYLWEHHGVCGTIGEYWTHNHKLVTDFYRTVEPMPGVMEFLRAMKAKGYLLGVATATSPAPAQAALESTGILPLLDARVSVSEIGADKTRPDIYDECARRMGNLRRDEVVVFEDALYCVKTLHANGFTVVGIHEPSIPDNEWEALAPLCSRTIEDYRELL